ncbi:MAG: hypothetical protein CME43_15565 [Haliea sp.]|uniref:glycosyltransferase n=1 Tax=Haliea sp. TaxID=1932666 RepID=UPI000C378DF3|nr:glycosyltransferase [Haliea sp.]MBM70882.1 hypothetical protein [Haliea sp.]
MNFCIVTPCLNAERYIERTMHSVIKQTALSAGDGSIFLEYIICDGGSTDATLAIAERIAHDFSSMVDSISIRVHSESDSGMYDAIAKGFQRAAVADIYAYVNAGDYYAPHALEILDEVFSISCVEFVTGFDVVYNEQEHMVSCRLPYGYSRRLIDKGFYGGLLPHIQQESTFWSASLHKRIDFDRLRRFKLAGDAYLWSVFSQHANLYVVSAWLAGFTIHVGQLSQIRAESYREEHLSICRRPRFLDFLLAARFLMANYLPDAIKVALSSHLIAYDHSSGEYRVRGDR